MDTVNTVVSASANEYVTVINAIITAVISAIMLFRKMKGR